MTNLIKKGQASTQLYFTLDREIKGKVQLELINDYDLKSFKSELPSPIINNERYTHFTVTTPFLDLSDGLYTYQLEDDNGILESGNVKIESDDFGQPNDAIEYDDNRHDSFITYDQE